jgi:DNA-directed RNA polymerase omega subunit
MKLKIMEKTLDVYPNRFELTMMAVARAREINDGDTPLVETDDLAKPVITALAEISQGIIVPATHDEMARIHEARRILRDKAMMEALEQDELLEEEESPDSVSTQEEISEGN